VIAEGNRKVKKPVASIPVDSYQTPLPVAFISILTILWPMRKKLLIFALLCSVLTACSATRRVSVESGYPGLRPWQRPYTVNGERYVPLLNAEGYREEGLASWYGTEEHGKPTSSGETYDMYKMTAAHKTLPLGSQVKVTSKENGRQTFVRVNDRGPFISGRVIDLSYQAARELGMVDCGVMPVTIEVIRNAPNIPEQNTASVDAKTYSLQVAAFSDREQAHSLAEKLKRGYSYSDIQPVQTEKGFFYRVRTGRFLSKEDAEAAKASFARMGYPDAFIVTIQ
jgi:rare lipoprotein A